jgi:hypothetical protein
MEDCEHIDCYESCPKRPKGADIPEDIDVPPNSEYALEGTTVTEISDSYDPADPVAECEYYMNAYSDMRPTKEYSPPKPRDGPGRGFGFFPALERPAADGKGEDPEKSCGTCTYALPSTEKNGLRCDYLSDDAREYITWDGNNACEVWEPREGDS